MVINLLEKTREYLGLLDDTSFDSEIKVYIDMSTDILKQHCDIGDDIQDYTLTISDDKKYLEGLILSFIFIKTKILFDPPSMSYNVTLMKEQTEELLWRIKTDYNVEK